MLNAASIQYVSPGSPNYDYHLQPSSPAIDQATGQYVGLLLSDDIDGQPRPFGSAPDIGADEYMPPLLTANPASLTVLTDGNQEISRLVLIGVSSGDSASWTATTNDPWLYLGSSGSSNTASGTSGDNLVVRFIPGNVPLDDYSGSISVTSPNADPASINTRLLKVSQLYPLHLPLIIR
jgi:hypothetical protein